jgi:outer membrane protein OmpA-like peptidoglycan-associated protein
MLQVMNESRKIYGSFIGYIIGVQSDKSHPFRDIYNLKWVDCELDSDDLAFNDTLADQSFKVSALDNVKVKLGGEFYRATLGEVEIIGKAELIKQGESRIHKVAGHLNGKIINFPPKQQSNSPSYSNLSRLPLDRLLGGVKIFGLAFYPLLLLLLALIDRSQLWTYLIPYAVGMVMLFCQTSLLGFLSSASFGVRIIMALGFVLDKLKPILFLVQVAALAGILWHFISSIPFSNHWPYLLAGAIPVSLWFIASNFLRRRFLIVAIFWTVIYFLLFWITLHPQMRTLVGEPAEITESETPKEKLSQPVPQKAKCVMKKFNVLKSALFDFDKASLKPQGEQIIKRLAQKVKTLKRNNPNVKLELHGHTDKHGTKKRNLKLSLDRANSVKEALKMYGVNPNDVTTRGIGSTKPISDQDEENRRVDIYVSCEEKD